MSSASARPDQGPSVWSRTTMLSSSGLADVVSRMTSTLSSRALRRLLDTTKENFFTQPLGQHRAVDSTPGRSWPGDRRDCESLAAVPLMGPLMPRGGLDATLVKFVFGVGRGQRDIARLLHLGAHRLHTERERSVRELGARRAGLLTQQLSKRSSLRAVR